MHAFAKYRYLSMTSPVMANFQLHRVSYTGRNYHIGRRILIRDFGQVSAGPIADTGNSSHVDCSRVTLISSSIRVDSTVESLWI
jgi:hypothetical protein